MMVYEETDPEINLCVRACIMSMIDPDATCEQITYAPNCGHSSLSVNPVTDMCEGSYTATCPANFTYHESTNTCKPNSSPICNFGGTFDQSIGKCVLVSNSESNSGSTTYSDSTMYSNPLGEIMVDDSDIYKSPDTVYNRLGFFISSRILGIFSIEI